MSLTDVKTYLALCNGAQCECRQKYCSQCLQIIISFLTFLLEHSCWAHEDQGRMNINMHKDPDRLRRPPMTCGIQFHTSTHARV